MKRVLLALAASSWLVCGAAHAAEEEGQDGLHFSARSVTVMTRDGAPGLNSTEKQVPTFQLLNFRGDNINGTGMFGAASGYLTQQLVTGSLSGDRRGDLAYGYLGWSGAGDNVRIQAGRQFVFAGAPRYVFMDGASAVVRLPGDLRVDIYGGTAALKGLDNAFQAPIIGGRLAWMPWEYGHLAVSFQDISGNDDVTRRTVGTDFSIRGLGPILWTGAAAYDLLGKGLQEVRLDGAWRPKSWLGLYLRGEARDPLAYLPRNSIFTAFVQRTDGLVGGGFDVRTPGALYANGSYDRYIVADQGLAGYRGQIDVGLRIDQAGNFRSGVTYARMSNGENGYDQARIYGRGRLAERFTVALDLDSYWFFHEVRATDRSLMASLALRWTVTRGATLGVDGQVWTSPFFTQQVLGMGTLIVTDAFFRRAPAAHVEPKAAPPADAKEKDEEGRLWRPDAPGATASNWTSAFDRPVLRGVP